MQYKYIANTKSHVKAEIFRKDAAFENCWHNVAFIDGLGTLRFSKLANAEEQKEINLFVSYNNLTKEIKKPAIYFPTLQVG
ncbi:MAG: hypothetical protein HFJ34_08370 [Clostridia bacterium]|nr:hypothetical protein [Clostridia bacterium]